MKENYMHRAGLLVRTKRNQQKCSYSIRQKVMYLLAGVGAFVLMTSGCGKSKTYQNSQFFAMDTIMSIELLGEKSNLDEVRTIVETLEDCVSVTDTNSELYQINHRTSNTVEISDTVMQLLQGELEITKTTDGALNPALYPISSAWGFTTDTKRVPSTEELAALLPKTDWKEIQLSQNQLTLSPEMELDFGATAKGFASELCANYLKECNVESALLDFGGNMYTIGNNKKGQSWKIGIRDPWDETGKNNVGVLESTNEAVITSGSYERYFEQDGKRYHHIIDGITGMPAESGLMSVTIVCENGLKADGLSTALFVMGLEKGSEYWRQYGGFEAIFIAEDGNQYYTEGLQERYQPAGKAEVIKK